MEFNAIDPPEFNVTAEAVPEIDWLSFTHVSFFPVSISISFPPILIVLPVFVKPAPASIRPAPENCVHIILSLLPPIEVNVEDIKINPCPSFTVPSVTKTKSPLFIFPLVSKSVVLVKTQFTFVSPTVVTL